MEQMHIFRFLSFMFFILDRCIWLSKCNRVFLFEYYNLQEFRKNIPISSKICFLSKKISFNQFEAILLFLNKAF